MTSAMYQDTGSPLLHGVATPQDETQTEDEELAVDSNEKVGQELREAVAKVLGVDPKELAPRRQG